MKKIYCALFLLVPHLLCGQQKYGRDLTDSLQKELKIAKNDTNQVKLLAILAFNFYRANPDSGIFYGEKGLDLAQQLNWQHGLAEINNALGVNYQFKSDYPHALACYQKALVINEEEHNAKGISNNISNIGMVYEAQSNFPKALEYAFRSLKMNEDAGNKRGMANNFVNIGSVYLGEKNTAKALDYFSKSAREFEEIGDKAGITGSKVVMGAFYLTQSNYPRALDYYKQALKIYQEAGNMLSEGLILGNIGKIYRKEGDYKQALDCDRQALTINETVGDKASVAEMYFEIGNCYFELATKSAGPAAKLTAQHPIKNEQLNEAIDYLNRSAKIYDELLDLGQAAETDTVLFQAYALAGDYKNALLWHINYLRNRDSVFSQQNKIKIANIESQRDLDLVNKELLIEKLKTANRHHEQITYFVILLLVVTIFVAANLHFLRERKRNKNKIISNEHKFQALIESSSDAVAIISAKGDTLYVSPSVHSILGYTVEETMKINLFDIVNPEDYPIIMPDMQKVMESPGVPVKGNAIRVRHKDGSWRWAEAMLTNMLHDPVINGIVDNFRDITDRKLAEEKVSQMNRIYAFISQINHTIVHTKDKQTLFSKACEIAVECGKFEVAMVMEYLPADASYKIVAEKNATQADYDYTSQNKFDPESRVGKMLNSGKSYVINNYVEASKDDARKQYASARGYESGIVLPIKNKGVVHHFLALFSSVPDFFSCEEITLLEEVASDISFALEVIANDRKRELAEQAHRQSEENLRTILDLIPNPIFAKDINGQYIFLNKSFASLFGMTVEELLMRKSIDTLPEIGEARAHLEQDLEIMRTGNPKILHEDTFTDYMGQQHIFYTVKVPYSVAGSDVPAVLGIATEITEQKLAEKERNEMLDELVKRNKNLEQFSYIISHNLRAPVANILGLLDLLQHVELDTERGKLLLRGLSTTAKSLDDVIKDLNQILQVKHQLNEQKEFVSFAAICEDVQLSIDFLLKREDVKLIADFTALEGIYSFKSYLYSIFLNLISNSIKYHQPGVKPDITIKSSFNSETKRIQLVFTDNGLGIDLAKKGGEVFGLYKRFHSHTEGKGMGLYMVKAQVESLGGTITIESKVNVGSTFIIEFDGERE